MAGIKNILTQEVKKLIPDLYPQKACDEVEIKLRRDAKTGCIVFEFTQQNEKIGEIYIDKDF